MMRRADGAFKNRRLLVFGCLTRAPSQEARQAKSGRCFLTKFGLAQFAARLLWRLDEERHLAVNIFDALPPHAVAARYTRPIHTHNAHPSTYSTFTAKPPVKTIKPGGFALGPQTMLSIGGDISIVGAVEPGRKS